MSTIISREQFLQDVRTEVESLKANATQEEVGKLDIETFDPDSQKFCIYGQMTGNCSSKRAKQLMDASCVRVTSSSSFIDNRSFDSVVAKINGDYTGQTWGENDGANYYYRRFNYLSMIEMYIFLKGASPKNIMDYIKCDVETLELPLE
jgi:hypothetical protein